jgi:PAS domain S-box-containing protein
VRPASERATERRNVPLREATLVQALTTSDRLGELLPVLHYHGVTAVGGRGAILYQLDKRGEWLHPTSAFGVEQLPTDPWPANALPPPLFRHGRPMFVADVKASVRGVAEYLDTSGAVLVPLAQTMEPIGLLIIGAEQAPTDGQLQEIASVGHAFTLAIERARAAREADLQRDLHRVLQEFSRTVSSTLTLAPALEGLSAGANRLFAADRTSVWLHDRRARAIVLTASTDVIYLAQEPRVSTADAITPAAVAMRRDRAEIAPTPGEKTGTLTIPLKGRRRALGTLVMEGARLEPGSEMDLLDRADELGRQLSNAIENVLLLDDVLRSRRQLENTFDSLTDLVAVCDRNGRLVYLNRAFASRLNTSRESALDGPLAELVGPETRELLARVIESDRNNQDPALQSAEIRDPVLEGTFVITITPLVVEEREPMGAVLVARDVTPHARLEAERAELRSRLVQSEKLAALGQFIAGIAHELNNPLQGVLGHLELLRSTGAFPKALRRDMQRIYREADRAAKIVRNLLVFAGSRRLVRRRTSVNATLSRVLALRAPAFRAAKIEVVRHHDDRMPRVTVDPLLLHQALLNIVLNAEQAIGGDGGRIEAHTRFVRNDDRSEVVVEIRDTGPGIPAEVLPRIFEPFYTTKEVGKGTGLGLAITYGIIQEHGGQIVVSNHPDGGALFAVHLPAEPD